MRLLFASSNLSPLKLLLDKYEKRDKVRPENKFGSQVISLKKALFVYNVVFHLSILPVDFRSRLLSETRGRR
jgi:hypothetical protein